MSIEMKTESVENQETEKRTEKWTEVRGKWIAGTQKMKSLESKTEQEKISKKISNEINH